MTAARPGGQWQRQAVAPVDPIRAPVKFHAALLIDIDIDIFTEPQHLHLPDHHPSTSRLSIRQTSRSGTCRRPSIDFDPFLPVAPCPATSLF